jgi:hypothetical protein
MAEFCIGFDQNKDDKRMFMNNNNAKRVSYRLLSSLYMKTMIGKNRNRLVIDNTNPSVFDFIICIIEITYNIKIDSEIRDSEILKSLNNDVPRHPKKNFLGI